MIISTFPGGGEAAVVTVPTFASGETFTYIWDGSYLGPNYTISNKDRDHIFVEDATSADVGQHKIVFKLKNAKRMVWADGTTADKTHIYTINKKPINIPKPTDNTPYTYVYNEKAQGPTGYTYDTNFVTVKNATGTNADTYTLTFSLVNTASTEWTDGTIADKEYPYTITKAPGTLTLSSDSVTLSKTATTATVTASGYHGTLSASSGDTTIATVSVDTVTGKITVTAPSNKTGNTTITITSASSANYETVSKSIAVKASFTPMKTFSSATNQEIIEMVQAADAGDIDLVNDCGWAVGQEHQVNLPAISKTGSYGGTSWSVGEDQPAQTVTLVLMDTGANSGYKFSSGGTANFVVGLKNSMATSGYMNSSSTNSGSWDGSARRKWCNGGFRRAMESVLPGVFKQFNVITAASYNGSSNKTSTDYFSMFAAKEIFGGSASSAGENTSWSNLTEFNALKQIKWYETSSNRIKKLGDNGSAGDWWERSPIYYYSDSFCDVHTAGLAHGSYAGTTFGLAPFGCL